MWVLGRYDRAWGPERPIYGKIRYMSSENTARKVRVKDYIATVRPRPTPARTLGKDVLLPWRATARFRVTEGAPTTCVSCRGVATLGTGIYSKRQNRQFCRSARGLDANSAP